MPVLAANQPYNPVPEVGPESTFVPTPGFQIRATPEAFGGLTAAATRQLGAQIGESANELAANVQARQQLFNQVAADDATNKYQEQENNLLYGNPAKPGDRGFFGLSGEEAMRAWPGIRQQMIDARNGFRGGLQNQAQQQQFDNETRRMQSSALAYMGLHYDREFNAYAEATHKSQYDLGLHAIAANPLDDGVADQGTAQMMRAKLADLGRRGLDTGPDAADNINAALTDARADAATQRVRALARDNTTKAEQVLDDNKDVLKGAPYDQLKREIDALASGKVVRDATNAIMSGRPLGGAPSVGPDESGPTSKEAVSAAARKNNVDPVLANAVAGIESSHGSSPDRPGSQYKGVFQLGNDERGGQGKGSIDNQLDQGTRVLAKVKRDLADALGREPTNAEVYLAHQQGVKGAKALLDNPGERAVLLNGYNEITGNVPTRLKEQAADWTAKQFTDWWRDRYQREAAKYSDQAGSGPAVPVTTAAATGAPAQPQPIPTTTPGAQPAAAPASRADVYAGSLDQKLQQVDDAVGRGQFTAEQGDQITTNVKRLWNAQVASEERLIRIREHEDAQADKMRVDAQKTTWAKTMADIERGNPPSREDLANLVETRQIDQSQLASIEARLAGRGQTDDPTTYAELNRRARNGEDVTDDVYTAIGRDKLRPQSGDVILNIRAAKAEQREDQSKRSAFATLRTIAGMDAADHPMVDLGREANQAQVQLWGQAQQEWDHRVNVGREDPEAVLADMIPRYGKPVTSARALPMPRAGAIGKLEDIQSVGTKTDAMFAAGQITQQQYQEEQGLIVKYHDLLEAEQKRRDAAQQAVGQARGRRVATPVPAPQ